MSRFLIAGYGYVGSKTAELLVADGHEVWGLRRSRVPMAAGVRPIVADLSDSDTLADLPDSLDGVVACLSPSGGSEAAYRAAYVTGVGNLLDAVKDKAQRVILTSSTSVYGQQGGEEVDERSPTEPDSATGRLVVEGERTLASSDLATAAVRFGGIYGPGRTRLIEMVQQGRATLSPTGAPPQYSNRVHLHDCAGILRHVLMLTEIEPVYNGVDCEAAATNEVYGWLAARLGVELQGSISKPHFLRGNKRCSNKLLLASGYQFIYPSFREGYGALIEGRR